jgi:hypothetical protein
MATRPKRPDVLHPSPIHVDPGGQEVLPGPWLTIAATSNAPIRFGEVYDSKRHAWSKMYVFPSEYLLRLTLAGARPTKAKPLKWPVEALENRFQPIDILQNRDIRHHRFLGGTGLVANCRLPDVCASA